VTVNAEVISSIGKGILVFAAVAPDDTRKEVESMASKILKLKMWPDEAGRTVKRRMLTKRQCYYSNAIIR
jgi:D-aminoacyl-tRNA deacylase